MVLKQKPHFNANKKPRSLNPTVVVLKLLRTRRVEAHVDGLNPTVVVLKRDASYSVAVFATVSIQP